MVNRAFNFLLSGGIGAVTNILVLVLLTLVFNIWYLFSSVFAFLVSTAVSFLLQKNLTFKYHDNDLVFRKSIYYLLIAIFNLGINTALVFLFTDYLGVYYIFSQIISSCMIATWSFFIYRHIFS
jgi:putative flippase GtrA